jgi:hypothetical protein
MEKERNPLERALDVGFVPTPTAEYRTHRKTLKATTQPGIPPRTIPVPYPLPPVILMPIGSRMLIYKQDPTVSEIGIRKVFIPQWILEGPKDTRIINGEPGLPPVSPNVFRDFCMTLKMYSRALYPAPIPWQWNIAPNVDPLKVYPHGLPGTMNAYYSRSIKSIKFGDFIQPSSSPPNHVFTCRSLDIVSHETGHAILDGLKPNWLGIGNPPQTGGLHEAFGDLTAIFLALSQLDQVEAVIVQTKANLHNKNFLADLAEQFGLCLGRPNGLRNADNDLKLSEVGTEVHAISQVFTGAIYDILADIFLFERKTYLKDDAETLFEVAQYVCSLVIRAYLAAPAVGATYADVANKMLQLTVSDGKPVQYRNYIRNRFTVREVVVSPTPLTVDMAVNVVLKPGIQDAPGAIQDRRACCGTMQLGEYCNAEQAIQEEIAEFRKALEKSGKAGVGRNKK